MLRRTIGFGILLAALGASALIFRPPPGTPSLLVQFVRYGSYNGHTNCAFVTVSNSGTAPLRCRGVSASYEHQLVRLRSGDHWIDANPPWLSPGTQLFELRPAESRLVPLVVQTNSDWSVCFLYTAAPSFWRRAITNDGVHEQWSDLIPSRL